MKNIPYAKKNIPWVNSSSVKRDMMYTPRRRVIGMTIRSARA
jgi:hypothetical protein